MAFGIDLQAALNALPLEMVSTKLQAMQGLVGNWEEPAVSPGRNVARYTEDLGWLYTSASNLLARTGQTQLVSVSGKPILFQRITSANFFASLEQRYGSASLAPFVAGQKYLVSFYAFAHNEQWFWLRPIGSGAQGHAPKCALASRITRHWHLVQATSASVVDHGEVATTALGGGTGAHPRLVQQGSQPALDMWIGGIQIEPVSNSYKDGIALIGDSTMAGASGGIDTARDFSVWDNREVSTVLSSALNVPVFNRAIGGDQLGSMDARWATDITPLAARSKYVIIQGGINDISNNRTLEQMQASVQSMVAKAAADGLIVRILNCTPTSSIAAVPAKEALRNEFNAWLSSTYGASVIDIASIAASPWDASQLNPAGYGDGVHYTGITKTAVAEHIASRTDLWEFVVPSEYQRVDPATAGAGNPARASVIDRSGSITTGGAAQSLMASNVQRRGLLIQNSSSGDLWINEIGGTAVAASPSIKILPGESYERLAGAVPITAISIIGATTGQTFTAREW